MQPYGPLEQLSPELWIRDGEWYETTFRRRMTVMALSQGELIIHNPFILKDEDLKSLTSLGKIVAIVAPNIFHGDEAGWMAEKLPEAKVFVPAAAFEKLKKKIRVDGTLEKNWPNQWSSDLTCLPMEGMRILHESVFFHRPSRTLVLTDLVFNLRPEDFKNNIERKLMNWNRVGTKFGPSWLCDHLFTKDKHARQRSVQKILSWDFDRIVMNHGHIVQTGGKIIFKNAFPEPQ
jgi:hypothetical protein